MRRVEKVLEPLREATAKVQQKKAKVCEECGRQTELRIERRFCSTYCRQRYFERKAFILSPGKGGLVGKAGVNHE